ncbi:predicted protein [Postia placenta Mad-698-R]|nr:predicted protein [Postia placenta Mad-698-R]
MPDHPLSAIFILSFCKQFFPTVQLLLYKFKKELVRGQQSSNNRTPCCIALAPLSTLSPEIVFLIRRSVEIAWHLIVFYATNFVAHVASVPLSVEVEGPDQHRSLSEGSFPWAVLVSLFLPFRTLGRDLLLIAQELRHHDDVLSALSHGTLLVLARTKDWRPNGEIGDEVFVKDTAKHPYAIIKLDEDKSCAALGEDERKVHGEAIVPPGYTLAVPMPGFKPFILATLFSVEKIRIHRPPEYLKIIVSAGQMISASFTLASTFGDQRDRYGYAAYGLSAWKSKPSVGTTVRTARGAFVHRRSDARKGQSRAVRTSRGVVIYYDRGLRPPATRAPKLASSFLTACFNTFILDEQNTQNSSDMSFRVDLTISPLLDGIGPTPDPALSRDTFLPASQQEYAAILVCLLLAMGLPYAVIYGLTRFHDGRSTITERVMMMLWLAANQLSGLGIVFYSAFLRIPQDSLKDATSRWDTWRRPMGAAFRWSTWHRLMDAARRNGSAVWKASWRWLKDAPSLKNHFKFRREGNSAKPSEGNSAKPSDAKPSDWLPRAYVAFLVLPAAGGLIMSTF